MEIVFMNSTGIKRIYHYWLDWKFSAKIISSLLCVTLMSIAALVVVNYLVDINHTIEQVGIQLVTLGDETILRAAEQVDQEVKLLETLAKSPFIVEAVKEANNSRAGWTPERIVSRDDAWQNELPSAETTVKEIAENKISSYLIDFRKSNPSEAEVFITDQYGLNIAMTDRTSDFLQADEDWWTSTFAEGIGSTYLGSVEYDESSKTYAMKIGVPVVDPDTQKAVGVLRGSLDISVMFNTLGNVRTGKIGNIVLINREGIVLYSHNPAHIMKPAPETLLMLLESGKNDWGQATDMDGKPSIVAYSPLRGEMREDLGWCLLITQQIAEISRDALRNLLMSVLASILVAGIGIPISVLVLSKSIAAPLTSLTNMAQELAIGNIIRNENYSAKEALHLRKDEIGAISRASGRLIQYFQEGVEASSAIANKDLTITVTPNSEKDELGVAFATMLEELQHVVIQVTANARAISCAAAQLVTASQQSGNATNQIGRAIQHVAVGITQQSEEVTKTSSSVEQMNRAIDEVAKGAQEQAQAVDRASSMTTQISSTIQQVTANAQFGARGTREAADAALNGARKIEATITGMQAIKTNVGLSAHRVREMGQRSEQIHEIVETIDDIASQTNLLALNAAIEAARVETQGEKTVEALLQHHMLGAANLLAQMLASGCTLQSKELETLARQAQLEGFFVSDSDGVITASSDPASLGFRFSEDPRHQSSVFRPLLNRQDGVVIQPIQARDQDGKPYVYVGVSRRDRPGIVQAGISGEVIYRLLGSSRGFAVVADEVRKLADHAKNATKEISTIIRAIQKAVAEAVRAMEDSVRDVESKSAQATEAGASLAAILNTVEAVNHQVGEIADVVEHMNVSSRELVGAMEVVSSVVEQNIAATEEMAANSSEMTRAMENIASVSEENSAAVEEVGANAEEINAQIDEVNAAARSLAAMARTLQELVGQFKVNERASRPAPQI
jgi:methyl-accepting chemotaxis protein